MNRRDFLKASASAGGSMLLPGAALAQAEIPPDPPIEPVPPAAPAGPALPDLSPARWIWYPSGRTLPNTFILFRRSLRLPAKPVRATGWICADSRYRLEINGRRVQWGPAPADPRWAEADPLDLAAFLTEGDNVLGATVVFFGGGDGTSPVGRPGFLFWLRIEHAGGAIDTVVSDGAWQASLCRAWPPGRPKRWYLRALQEEFDARLHPAGWSSPGFKPASPWLAALPLEGSPNRPSISTNYPDYLLDVGTGPAGTELRPRSIPLLSETLLPAAGLVESHRLDWRIAPADYFDFRVPDAFRAERAEPQAGAPGPWRVDLDGVRTAALTFDFAEQVVGWPGFTIEAPAGTTVELLVQEAHGPGGPALLNTHFDSWTRFICRGGREEFETFDFESLRWLQLHFHGAAGTVLVGGVRVRRRAFPWPNRPHLRTSEPALQRLFDASLNTLANCAQETLVDGMARERQQYSGDGGHQMHAVHLCAGETRLVARYLATWSQGMTKDGFFLDCWPAYDRMARLAERQLDLTDWGPLLDHGAGFTFDCWHHYAYTADLAALREPYPRLVRFARYLQERIGPDGLLPVENLGIPTVWMDVDAYARQRHKQCAFNLYVAAAMERALAPLCRAFGNPRQAAAAEAFGRRLARAVVARFWSPDRGLYVANLPWLAEEGEPRTCDRSLATSILFDQCPGGRVAAARDALVACPPQMGLSYPANAGWRLWALAKAGRGDVIVADLRRRWATMASVRANNTLQEEWESKPDTAAQWSHCAVVPLYIAFHGLMGLRPLEPGFARFELRPQLGDLADLELTAFTVRGPVGLTARGGAGGRTLTLALPPGGGGELVLPLDQSAQLPQAASTAPEGCRRYALPAGGVLTLRLRGA